jgi:threonine dehydratase
VVYPAWAAAVAIAGDESDGLEPPVAVVLSGGNIDPLLTMRVLRHGMTAAGRYLSLHVRVPDRPGELARLLAELAATGANVLDVEHARTGRALHLDEVEVHLVLEMHGGAHRDEVLSRLRSAGYPLSVD